MFALGSPFGRPFVALTLRFRFRIRRFFALLPPFRRPLFAPLFHSFFLQSAEGRRPFLGSRDDLVPSLPELLLGPSPLPFVVGFASHLSLVGIERVARDRGLEREGLVGMVARDCCEAEHLQPAVDMHGIGPGAPLVHPVNLPGRLRRVICWHIGDLSVRQGNQSKDGGAHRASTSWWSRRVMIRQ
jgi:hypothetical protein